MLYVFQFLITIVSVYPVLGDIPDNVLDSGIYEGKLLAAGTRGIRCILPS